MIKITRQTTILLILGVIFLFIYSYLALSGPEGRFNSPDEAANYFWLSRVAQGEELKLVEPLNLESGNMIHSRSDNVNMAGEIVPGSFLGLIVVYGFLAKMFSIFMVGFFTPILAVLAVFAFYTIIKKIFSINVALISSILLLIHPAWWYYTSRGLLPNVLFCSLVIFGFWFLLIVKENKKIWWHIYLKYFSAGLMFGSALLVRTSEAIWLVPILVALAIFYRKKVNWLGIVLMIVVMFLLFIPLLNINLQIYGGPLLTGYSNLGSSAVVESTNEIVPQSIDKSLILPFGFHPRVALVNSWNYYIEILWWYFIPLIFGLILLIKKISAQEWVASKSKWIYLMIFAVVTDWLVIYYGSWFVKDNISGHATIGTAYLRYWLPAFILALPLVAYLIEKLLLWFKSRVSRILVGTLIFGLFFTFSVNLVFVSEDGLLNVAKSVKEYQLINSVAIESLSPDSIIISDRDDKKFWPQFRVVKLMGDWSVFEKSALILERAPVYYYSHNKLTDGNFELLNNNMSGAGIEMIEYGSLNGEDRLYELKTVK